MSIPWPELLAAIEKTLGVEQQIQSHQQAQAQQATLDTVLAAVNGFGSLTQIVLQQVLALQSQLRQVDADLANLISLCQQRGQPVTLPSTPPAGYGGASASDVWLYVNPFIGEDSQTMFAEVWKWLQNYLLTVNNAGNSPFGILVLPTNYTLTNYAAGIVGLFKADLSVVTPADTLETWLAGQNPTWTFIGPTNGKLEAQPPPPYYAGFNYLVDWPEAYFQLLKAFQLGTLVQSGPTPPVWPGIAKVTLGASQALVDGLLIPGPLDGVIIAITAVPSPISYYPFGPVKSYVHVGGIAFVDDNGQVETVQPIGLDSNVVCPKSMIRADHAYIRLQSGVTGTVRPWTSP